MPKFNPVWQEIEPLPERVAPPGGWQPVCRVEDHTWEVYFEAGSFHLSCLDAHTEEQIEMMEPNGYSYGCHLHGEELAGTLGPFKLKWHVERYFEGDCDAWVEPEPLVVITKGMGDAVLAYVQGNAFDADEVSAFIKRVDPNGG